MHITKTLLGGINIYTNCTYCIQYFTSTYISKYYAVTLSFITQKSFGPLSSEITYNK